MLWYSSYFLNWVHLLPTFSSELNVKKESIGLFNIPSSQLCSPIDFANIMDSTVEFLLLWSFR